MTELSNHSRSRTVIIILGIMLFIGMIVVSLLFLRYPVKGLSKTELFVTKQSLTHAIVRAKDGKLTTVEQAGKACPT